MNPQIIAIIVSALGIGTLVSGLLLRKIDRRIATMDKKSDEREAARIEDSILMMQSVDANGELSRVIGIAIKNGRMNGELEGALAKQSRATSALQTVLYKHHAEKIHQE